MKLPRNSARFNMRPVALALACMGAAPAFAQLPTWNNFQVRGGAVAVGTPTAGGTQLGIVQGTQRAIVDWQGFSIGPGHAVNIAQPGAASVLLNRVTGNELSAIAGSLNANGRVFLVNPNGVLFGSGASVNVGGLVASTLKMSTSDSAFMNGTERFEFKQDGSAFGTVENRGGIAAHGGGTIALIGAQVSNSGSIVAQGGSAGLVSGDTVTVDFAGDGLTTFKVSSGLYSGVANSGVVQADGGRVVMMASAGSELAQGVVNTRGVLRADSLASRNGEIVLDSGGSAAGVTINGGVLSAAGNGPGLKGGSVDIKGRTILLQAGAPDDAGVIDASGSAGGGRIRLQATAVGGEAQTGAIAVASGSRISADATGAGHGGDLRLLGERTLRAHGTLSARGGPNGGDGGYIETSGGYAMPAGESNGGIDLAGLRADASAPHGTAGTWLIDPFNVTIVNGDKADSLTSNPFAPVDKSTIQDDDINFALNGGSSVRITTGKLADGAATDGIIVLDDVQIEYSGNKGALDFQLDAHLNILVNGGSVIASVGDPLNVILNGDANVSTVPFGIVTVDGAIYTNGGNVAMSGRSLNSSCTICLDTALIDTRTGNKRVDPLVPGVYTGGSNAGIGGSVQITGVDTGKGGGFIDGALYMLNSTITTATGDVTLFGSHGAGSGVQLANFGPSTTIVTTGGNVSVTGIGSFTANSSAAPGHGVVINGETITTVDGNITVTGRRLDGGTPGNGVLLSNDALLQTTGIGDIVVTGQSDGDAAGVNIAPQASPTAPPAGRIDGNHNVVLRAVNDGNVDAIAIGGTVRAGNVLNLRPGGVDLAGNGLDRPDAPITLGSAGAAGFAVSAAEFALLDTPTVVAGSNAHAADITMVGPLALASSLTLQNGAGGNIRLAAPFTTTQDLGLISAGNITQASGASIEATRLLARSSGGDVLLNDPGNNVAVGTVGGGAAGRFEYTDANAVTLGAVPVTGFDAASNLPQALPGTGVSANTVFVRTLSGDLSLATDVTSANGTDLVAGARFHNLGAYTITGAPWRVWADTWVGETRGGLAGSGLLPNLYHCAYLGLCTVSIPAGANHFIYAQQPSAVVVVHNVARPGGVPNPQFTYSITGLILGDTGAGFVPVLSSPATPFSLPGLYAINGGFISAEGYAVSVVPGLLTVGDIVQLPKPDVLRESQSTWLYDRNIGPAPICLATGPLGGDRAAQGGDVLAREWSRVRSRPNLTNCIDTERRNGCADF